MYCKIYTILTTDAQLGGRKKSLTGFHIAPQIANFLENLKKYAATIVFILNPHSFMPPTLKTKSNSTIKFFNISSDSIYFCSFFEKFLQIGFLKLHSHILIQIVPPDLKSTFFIICNL